MPEAITFDIGTVRDDATIMYSYRSRRNYARAELARKRRALDSPTRRSMRAWRLNATRRLGIESPEAERNLMLGIVHARDVSTT